MTKDFCEDCGVKLTDSNRSKAYRNKCKQCVANNERRKRNQRIENSKRESVKSIREKAEEYGYANWQSDDYHEGASEGLDFDPIGHTQKSFEAGANYVIEEIEKVIRSNSTCEKAILELGKLVIQLNK